MERKEYSEIPTIEVAEQAKKFITTKAEELVGEPERQSIPERAIETLNFANEILENDYVSEYLKRTNASFPLISRGVVRDAIRIATDATQIYLCEGKFIVEGARSHGDLTEDKIAELWDMRDGVVKDLSKIGKRGVAKSIYENIRGRS